jgi:uncharacterized protein YajQ (UPF0234 family)
MNNQSERGKLISEVVQRTIEENIFECADSFKKTLERELDKKFDFKTIITDIERKNTSDIGWVYFENEDGNYSAICFSILHTQIYE